MSDTKAFRVFVPGYSNGIIWATTAGKARYQAYRALRDAIGNIADIRHIKIQRAPEYDTVVGSDRFIREELVKL